MPFIGNQPALSYTSFAKQDFTTSATTSYTLNQPVANENEIALFINFVRQEPTTAYSASGTTLTLTSATSASDDMYCVFLGKAVQTVNPPSGSVGTSQLDSSLDFSSKTITLASNMKNTPAFHAYLSSTTNISNTTLTKVTFDTELWDTNSSYDNSNGRFTVPSGQAGKYSVASALWLNTSGVGEGELYIAGVRLYKNGSVFSFAQSDFNNVADDSVGNISKSLVTTIDLAVGDYVEIYAFIGAYSGQPQILTGTKSSWFSMNKLIG